MLPMLGKQAPLVMRMWTGPMRIRNTFRA